MVYKFTIAPKSAIGTPFRSDTLFGHACWTILQHFGKERFDKFSANAKMQKPELIFSDGFPAGWLPRPLLPKKLMNYSTVQERSFYKKVSKRKWVYRQFAENCNWDFLVLDTQKETIPDGYNDTPVSDIQLRNTINRFTGTSQEKNGLFSYERNWYNGIWSNVDIYVSTFWSINELTDFIKKMFEVGYGRDQTIGLGAVEIVTAPIQVSFQAIGESEYYLVLSRCVPDSSVVMQNSFFQIEPKYGKVWSGFETKNPFKKAILQIVPGSVLQIKSASETAGRVLIDIHDDNSIFENCMTVLYPIPDAVIKEYSI